MNESDYSTGTVAQIFDRFEKDVLKFEGSPEDHKEARELAKAVFYAGFIAYDKAMRHSVGKLGPVAGAERVERLAAEAYQWARER